MNLLPWEAIRHFRGMGAKQYEFVGVRSKPRNGSKQEGLMLFKERIGGSLAQGCLGKIPFNSLQYLAYSSGVRLLRCGDIVDLEQHKLDLVPPDSCIANACHASVPWISCKAADDSWESGTSR